jgi:hypothetical protein
VPVLSDLIQNEEVMNGFYKANQVQSPNTRHIIHNVIDEDSNITHPLNHAITIYNENRNPEHYIEMKVKDSTVSSKAKWKIADIPERDGSISVILDTVSRSTLSSLLPAYEMMVICC